MSNTIATMQQMQVPAYLQNGHLTPEQVKAMNAGAAMGTGGGGINRISLKQSRFRLIVGGQETMVLPYLNLQLVALRVHDGITKTYYAKEYNGNEEGEQPDCSSDDGIVPRADAPNKQCDTCAACPQNVWGSKISRTSGAKIKACTDSKRMAVLPPNAQGRFADRDADLYQLSIPPASLGDWGTFVRSLGTLPTPAPYNGVVVDVSFDSNASYPKLLFKPVRYLEQDEWENVQARFNLDDTKRVTGLPEANPVPAATAQMQQQVQQPVQQQVQQQVQQPVQQAQVQQAQVQQPAAGWGQPQVVEQPVQQAAGGWGQPAQVQQPVQQAQVQQAQVQQPVQQVQQPTEQPVARTPGQPAPGRKRRTKEEMAEDEAYFARQAGGQQQVQQPLQGEVLPPESAQQAQVQQPVQQAAPGGWGQPAQVQQAVQQVQQAQVQQPAAGWGEPQVVAQPQQAQVQQPQQFDQSNPWAGAPGAQQATGAPVQPGVVTDPNLGGAFAGWDDPQ